MKALNQTMSYEGDDGALRCYASHLETEKRAMIAILSDPAFVDLLKLLREKPIQAKDQRLNPLAVIDLMDAGLLSIDRKDATLSITAEGLFQLGKAESSESPSPSRSDHFAN